MVERILRPKAQVALFGVSRTTLWRFEKLPGFPKTIKLGDNSRGRLESECLAWLRSRQEV